jgi:hypothetical protein
MTTLATFESQYESALRQVQAKGAPVDFTTTTATHDDASGTFGPPTIVIVSGYAARVRGKPLLYERLNLIESESPTLLFVPVPRGSLPALTATVIFGGIEYGIADLDPLDPDGEGAILARVVVKR